MKITHDLKTFRIRDMVMMLMPCRARNYVKKFGKVLPYDIDSVTIQHSPLYDEFKAAIIRDSDPAFAQSHAYSFVHAPSYRAVWKAVLDKLAEVSNMRNAEELCIWLDMKDI